MARRLYSRKNRGGKTGYRRRSYMKRSFRPRSGFRRYSAGARISSINQRIYAMLKKLDMRFRYHKPKFTLVEKKKRKPVKKASMRSTKAQLAAMDAIREQAAKNVAGFRRATAAPVVTPEDMMASLDELSMSAALSGLPSNKRYASRDITQLESELDL